MDRIRELPLQEGQLGVGIGVLDVQCGQDGGLFSGDGGDAGDRHPLVDRHALLLDSAQLRQGHLGRGAVAGGLQALAHHAVQDQGHEADAGVGADALGQAVEDRRNLDLGLQHLEAPLDVGQALVSVYDLRRAKVLNIGDQQQLAIHHMRAGQRLGVDVVSEEVGLESTFTILDRCASATSWEKRALAPESLSLRSR